MARTVEKEKPKPFVGKRPHRRDEILAELGIQRIDPRAAHVCPKHLQHRFARGEDQVNGGRPGSQYAAQGFGGLRPYSCDRTELAEQQTR